MKLIYHKNLRSTWFKYSYDEQMGNIGSEISRTKSALEKNDREMAYGALQRGLELIDLTLTDPRRKSKIVELKNARKTFLNCCERQQKLQSKMPD